MSALDMITFLIAGSSTGPPMSPATMKCRLCPLTHRPTPQPGRPNMLPCQVVLLWSASTTET